MRAVLGNIGPRSWHYGPSEAIFPSTALASSVSKLFIIWHACFSFYINSVQIFRIIILAWRMFVLFIHLENVGKISIFLASSGSLTVKNDNIHSFWLFWLQILNLPASRQNKNTRIGPFPWKLHCTAKS